MFGKICILLVVITLPLAQGAAPGTFFWKPRLGLDLAVPTTERTRDVNQPTFNNIHNGYVVMIDGYSVGLTVLALATDLSLSKETFPHLAPSRAPFWTNAYRWGLRYMSLIPVWLGGNAGNYVETHKTWRKRFHYMDKFMPKWMRKLFPYIKKEDWAREEREYKSFRRFAEPAFGKHYRLPNKRFNNFASFMTTETVENYGQSDPNFDR